MDGNQNGNTPGCTVVDESESLAPTHIIHLSRSLRFEGEQDGVVSKLPREQLFRASDGMLLAVRRGTHGEQVVFGEDKGPMDFETRLFIDEARASTFLRSLPRKFAIARGENPGPQDIRIAIFEPGIIDPEKLTATAEVFDKTN